jgi:hypothetical protein
MRLARAAGATAFLAHGVVAALAGALLLYAHPQIDDLARATRVRDHGILTSTMIEYTTWAGRWLGTGTSYAVSRFLDLRRHYALVLGVIPLVYLLALYSLVRSTLTSEVPRRLSLCFAASLMALLWTGLGTPGETFYWFTGAVENQLGIALPVVLVAWLLRMPPRDGLSPSRWARLLAVAALALALPGLHELYGSILLLALAAGALIAASRRDARRAEWAVGALACAFGLAIVVLAPGNGVRLTDDPASRSTEVVARLLPHQALPLWGHWLLAPTLLAATLAFALHPVVRRLRPSWAVTQGSSWKWFIPSATLAVEVYVVLVCYWLRGRPVAPRTLSAMYMILLLGWFATVFIWTRSVEKEPPEIAGPVALAVFAAALLLSPNTRDAWQDLRWRAPAYDRALRQRDAFIEAAVARGDLFVSVPPSPTEPVLFMHADLGNNPHDYRNYHYTRFYRLQSLRLNGDSSPNEPLRPVGREGGPPVPSTSLLADHADGLGDPEGPLPEWSLDGKARRMIAPMAWIDFSPPPGSRSCALEVRALSTVPRQTLEVRANGKRVFLHRFRALGQWHDILSTAFVPKEGTNRLVLRAGSDPREEGRNVAVLLGEITLRVEQPHGRR